MYSNVATISTSSEKGGDSNFYHDIEVGMLHLISVWILLETFISVDE